jgi:hypothetical protein
VDHDSNNAVATNSNQWSQLQSGRDLMVHIHSGTVSDGTTMYTDPAIIAKFACLPLSESLYTMWLASFRQVSFLRWVSATTR